MKRFLPLLVVVLLSAPVCSAQETNVYLVKMFGCAHKPAERSQSGFRVRGVKGIITALHGVGDCQTIKASSKEGLYLDQTLNIVKIDADHDVALLSSSQLDNAEDGGFEVATKVIFEALGMVRVYGHPYGISSLDTTLTVRNPALRALKELVPTDPLSILMDRRSPNHLISVLTLQGNLLPGHSGAPVLDAENRVVAVANGGLKGGFAGISWAIPFRDIEWVNTGSGGRLQALKQLDPTILFANVAEPPEEVGDFCGQLSSLITASIGGFYSIVGVGDANTESREGFKSIAVLSGSLTSVIEPRVSVYFVMYETDVLNEVEGRYFRLVSNVSDCFPTWKKKEITATPQRFENNYIFREDCEKPVVNIAYLIDASAPNNNSGRKKFSLRLYVFAPDKFPLG